ncbi:MAG TPA: VTT domain-containing protein [Bacteroidota bacterium]|nr:VTT domain-containing protein [Bacteroidota bacterium]
MDVLKELFSRLTDIKELVSWAGYPGLALIVFSETGLLVGFFLPGDSMLVTAGLFAAAGYFNIIYLNLLLMAAAISGDAVGYYIGRKSGQALYAREDSRFFKRAHLIKTHEFYEQYGGITIIMARFMPFARTFAPVVAGIAQMTYVRFAAYNIIGGIGWVLSMTLIGYFLGSMIPGIDKHIELVVIVIVILSLMPGIIKYLRVKYGSH